MSERCARLTVPAEAAFARSVRMTAAALAVGCGMSVEDVEDVRMIAEEGFVYSCASAPEQVDVSFSLGAGHMALDFSLGPVQPDDDSVELARALLGAVCDEFGVSDDGTQLHLARRAGSHDE